MKQNPLALCLVGLLPFILIVWALSSRADGADLPASGQKLPNRPIFPADDVWNRDISKAAIDADTAAYIASMGAAKPLHPDFGSFWNGHPMGIPYIVVPGSQRKVSVKFQYTEESDPGPYPIPPDAPIEGGANAPASDDRHVLVIDRDNWMLYELLHAFPQPDGAWKAASGAIWDLKKKSYGQRPESWTSADAAGLPIFPGLVRYDEVEAGQITHAIRFSVPRTRRAYIFPATHFASRLTDSRLPPMGLRVRLTAAYDISAFPKRCQVVLACLKKYGMILADNGSPWFISGVHDPRWNTDEMHQLTRVMGSDFEVVKSQEGQ